MCKGSISGGKGHLQKESGGCEEKERNQNADKPRASLLEASAKEERGEQYREGYLTPEHDERIIQLQYFVSIRPQIN